LNLLIKELVQLKITIHHFPVAKSGFEQPKLLANTAVSDEDLEGYFVYLKEIQNIEEMASYAQRFYQEAHKLTDQKKYEAAIDKYTKAHFEKALEIDPGNPQVQEFLERTVELMN